MTESPKRRFSQKTADLRRFTPSPGNSSIFGVGGGGQKTYRTPERWELAPKVARQKLGQLAIFYRISVERGQFQGPWKFKISPPPSNLRRFDPPLRSPTFGGRRKPQKTADRKPKIFAENRRKPQIGLRHLSCVTFRSALAFFPPNFWASRRITPEQMGLSISDHVLPGKTRAKQTRIVTPECQAPEKKSENESPRLSWPWRSKNR